MEKLWTPEEGEGNEGRLRRFLKRVGGRDRRPRPAAPGHLMPVTGEVYRGQPPLRSANEPRDEYGAGDQERARRRRQIESGQLTEANGLNRNRVPVHGGRTPSGLHVPGRRRSGSE